MPTQRNTRSGRAIVLFIAAHNEEDTILCALQSVETQTRRPDRVVVVADRCTDATVARATTRGAEIVETVDNVHRKAGALNQALRIWLPLLDSDDIVMMMDADTELSPQFIESGERRLDQVSDKPNAPIGAVGGIFTAGRPLTGLIWALQRNEYLRYGHDLNRRHGRADVITGTSGMFRVSVLRHITAERGQRLPSGGYVYSNSALTEDDELTLAMKTLGYRCASPRECTVLTEAMSTLQLLFHQRLRWQRGALEDLKSYGLTAITGAYFARQAQIYLFIAFTLFFFFVFTLSFSKEGAFPWSWPWAAASLLVVGERIWTVRSGGKTSILLASAIIPEIFYNCFLGIVFFRAALDFLFREPPAWNRKEKLSKQIGRSAQIFTVRIKYTALLGLMSVIIFSIAWLSIQSGVQWLIVGAFVAAGIAHSALRTSGYDPLRAFLGDCSLTDRRPPRSPYRKTNHLLFSPPK